MRQVLDPEIASVLTKIRQIRVSKGITVEDLANSADLSRSYIYYIEKHWKVPTLTVLKKIADVLGVKMIDFFISDKS